MKSLILRKNLWKTISTLWKTFGGSVDNCGDFKKEDKKMQKNKTLEQINLGVDLNSFCLYERLSGVHMYRAFLAVGGKIPQWLWHNCQM